MNNAFSNKNNIANAIDLNLLKLDNDFARMLLFVTEICAVKDAFISLADVQGHSIKSKIGLDYLTNQNDIICFQELVNGNEFLIISDLEKDPKFQSIDVNNTFKFFAGFLINIPGSLVPGTVCIFNREVKELSSIELKTLQQTISQIESLLQLNLDNQMLQETVYQKENNFDLLIKNSLEVFYQFDLEGNVIYVSKNWSSSLGYSNDDLVGSSYSKFIHPDDLDSSSEFLNKVGQKKNVVNEHAYRIRHKDGHYIWFSCKIELLENNKGTFFIGASRDITDYVESQNKLVLQKEFYEKIIKGIPSGVAVFDGDFRYIYLNPNAIVNKRLRKFIVGKNDFDYAKKTNREATFAINRTSKYEEAILKKQTIVWEEVLYDKLGQKTYHSRKISPLFHKDGTLDMLIGFGVDITESKNAQLELLKSKQLTSSVIKNVGVGILVQGPQSEIVENNDAACEMLGLTQDQLLGKTSFDKGWSVIHLDGTTFKSEDHPVPKAIKQLKPLHNIVMGVHRNVTNDLVWLLVNAIPVFGDNEELIYVICSFSDITALKAAEDALKISIERFEHASKATSDAMWDWDLITDDVFFGGTGTTLFGHIFENNTLKVSESLQFVHPDDRDYVVYSLEKAFDEGATGWSTEYRYLKSDNTFAYVKDKAVILRDVSGKAIRAIGVQQDITNEKILKDELIQSEEQFKGAFINSPVGMAIVGLNGNWLIVNNQMEEIFGYTDDEFKVRNFLDLTHPDDVEEDQANLELLMTGGISTLNREKKYIHKNGSIIWIHLSVAIVKNSLGDLIHFISQFVDITKRKALEKTNRLLVEENNKIKNIQLDEAKNRYRLLADNMIDLVCLHGLDSSFQYVSPSIHAILGYYPEDLIGLTPLDFIHPQDKEKLQKSILGFITEREYLVARLRFKNKKGDYVWCETTANLVKEKGKATSFHSATRDITLRMEAEEKVKRTLQKERELNELKSNLVSTISHEFRTPMTTIRASAELIQMYLKNQKIENQSLLEKRVNTIIGEIDRLVELMNTVLIISKNDLGKTDFTPVNFDLKETCFDVFELCDVDQKKGRNLITSFEGDTFPVFADIKLMEYTLINLVNNAFKYSVGCGDVVFNLFSNEVFIIVEIIDFGIGIPEEDQDKLFNTFYRASNTIGIQGTGLGLYIVKIFTERNSGLIKLESKLGEGTKVTLQFPKLKK
ncbi:PAS domain S-box protein [Flavobacterium sp. 7A]|uniref:PAS domain S-box protein n=1 Tax=Flavobacterium sp. 7A TaxID=2940571 RepID=UPI0022265E69|nr:PAS domain S-box protein [Flavobacterium sp. 7A]MCW2120304.1 PAS domain S-box-containing protein [Flavobacterium sp. 7A]